MKDEQFDKILDRLPFLDGSLRRRFVAGGIVVLTIVAFNLDAIASALGEKLNGVGTSDVLHSPFLTLVIALCVYAVGSIVDLFGEIYLVRAASGVFWAIAWPMRRVDTTSPVIWRECKRIALWLCVPVLAIAGVVMGLFGMTRYALPLNERLYREFAGTPVEVGLREPVGDKAEIAIKHVLDRLGAEADRRWARRLIGRAKDVAAITTALLVALFYVLVTGRLAADVRSDAELSNLGAAALAALERHVGREGAAHSVITTGVTIYPLRLSQQDVSAFRIALQQGDAVDRDQLNLDLDSFSSTLAEARASLTSALSDLADLAATSPPYADETIGERLRRVSELTTAPLPRSAEQATVWHNAFQQDLTALAAFFETSGASDLVEFQQTIDAYEAQRMRVTAASRTDAFYFAAFVSPLFLLLYLGYFISLRNAITAILETLVLKNARLSLPFDGADVMSG